MSLICSTTRTAVFRGSGGSKVMGDPCRAPNLYVMSPKLNRDICHPKTTGTAKSLKSLIDATNRCIRSMKLMGYKKDKSIEPIYVHQILSKLDPCAKDLWEHTLKDKDMPSFDELCEFLERHASALDENPQQQNKPKSSNAGSFWMAMSSNVGLWQEVANCAFVVYVNSMDNQIVLEILNAKNVTKPIIICFILKMLNRTEEKIDHNKFIIQMCVVMLLLIVEIQDLMKEQIMTKTIISIEEEIQGSVDVTFGPYFDETKLFNMEAYIVPKISKLPMKEIGNSVVSHLPKINLADPEFQTSAEIDILVGAELYYEIVDGEKNMDSSTSPIAIKSQLGWLIGGSKTTSKRELTMCHTQTNELEKLNHSENTLKLETLMKSFWELETLPALPILSNEEKLCEVLFNKTVKRDCDGSFIVQYPFKEPRIELGSSLSIAIRQFKQVEKRFPMQIHPKLCMYHALQQEYLFAYRFPTQALSLACQSLWKQVGPLTMGSLQQYFVPTKMDCSKEVL
ncbi:hypothetical protein Fcan01_22761 [Folsomia candida]|uniref:Uncharacterized protein n=1 Tax=Folsomia candida TaxID=158441 RepID=A0A226DC77_FOLCA|nr:hypothetical protein Fcan01_22761 [Folsomia candida]